ncbi:MULTISPECIES: hypothetical protein [Streptomyces]|uniref:Uncharacterized protein n=1 Tax=Streptomyces eurythermus TaxID=42237 RepID=A0ABW6Z924_9ACTN|nr:hypothetical protein [Streptomyces sp. DSM 40868]QIS75534.1 hypothetical protein HB370_41065 [Streptomyces sp. DSM 40868]
MVLHHLVAADSAAWTSDVPSALNALKVPELAAAAGHADRPGAFPGGALARAVTAALGLVRNLDSPATAGHWPGRRAVLRPPERPAPPAVHRAGCLPAQGAAEDVVLLAVLPARGVGGDAGRGGLFGA